MVASHTQQIQSVGEVLNFPFEESNELLEDADIVDEAIDGLLRGYVRLWPLEVTNNSTGLAWLASIAVQRRLSSVLEGQ